MRDDLRREGPFGERGLRLQLLDDFAGKQLLFCLDDSAAIGCIRNAVTCCGRSIIGQR